MIQARHAVFMLVACAGFAASPVFAASDQVQDDQRARLHGGVLDSFTFEIETAADLVVRAGQDTPFDQALSGDISIAFDLESVTQGGLRWGLAGQLRAQRDSGRRGLSAQIGDCVVPSLQCSARVGSFTGFYSAPGPGPAGSRAGIEALYGYVKSALFEVRLGAGPGAAALEIPALPGAFRLMRADGGLVDPSGLSLASTQNTLSGLDAKILLRSRRLAGFQLAASFTPTVEICGVDVCIPDHATPGLEVSETRNVTDLALSFDHRFAGSGARWSMALTASRGESAGPDFAVFEDPYSVSARVSWSKGAFSVGGGVLHSNDGVEGGDYLALAGSAAFERGAWLTALEWAHADSDLVHAAGWSLQLGSSRLFESGALVGAGLRYDDRFVARPGSAGRERREESALSVFVESGLRF